MAVLAILPIAMVAASYVLAVALVEVPKNIDRYVPADGIVVVASISKPVAVRFAIDAVVLLICKPFQLHVLVPPAVQAVKVGGATLIAFKVFTPEELAPPPTLTVEAMLKPFVIGVKEAVLAEVCSVAEIFRPLVVIEPVMVAAVANDKLARVPVSAAPWA